MIKDRPEASIGLLPLCEVSAGLVQAGLVVVEAGKEQQLAPQQPLRG